MRTSLRVAVGLFLAWGGIWSIGLVGIFALFARGFPPWFLWSPDFDRALFGMSPDEIRAFKPAAEVQWYLSHLLGMTIAAAGLGVLGVTWFGLRRGERWALWILCAMAAPIAVILPYVVARYPGVGVLDVPPFITTPCVLVPPAIVFGFIATRRDTAVT